MSLVSVILPTLGRADLLPRALASVFNQTHKDLEVIVIIDGPDRDTEALLGQVDDPRLKVISNKESMTAAGARNIGIEQAEGEWVAFIDDDDEWLPEKIEIQIEYARSRTSALVSCLSRVVTLNSFRLQPEILYRNDMPIDEYLFDQRSLFSTAGFLQTSSWLLRRSDLEIERFKTNTPHDDWDLLLRLVKIVGLRVETVPQELAVVYVQEGRPSLSTLGTWQASLSWIDSLRPMISRRAYGGFCLGVVGPRARQELAVAAIPLLLYRTFRHGSPRPWRIAMFLGLWLIPRSALRTLRIFWRRKSWAGIF